VVPKAGYSVEAQELRRQLGERLPDYMIPAALVEIERLPLTASGKVDRQALISMGPPRMNDGQEYVAPRTVEEEILAGIWAGVLGIDRVSANDDFIELGGHSLLATRVVSRVRETFRIDLPLRAIFEEPILYQLAHSIRTYSKQAFPVPPIKPIPRDRQFPLSFAQQRLWFLNQLTPNIPLYNTPTALRLTGPFDES